MWNNLTAAEKQDYLAFFNHLESTVIAWARRFSSYYTVHKLGKHWYEKLGSGAGTENAAPAADVYHNWADHGLYLAVTGPTDNPDTVRILIERFGADPHKKSPSGDDSFEPIHWAAARGHKHVVRMLNSREFSISIDAQSERGYTPLHAAVRGDHGELVKMLIADCHAKPETRAHNGYTPLHIAAEEGHKELARMLITAFQAGAYATDNDGRMPIHIAARAGHTEFARMLIDDFSVSPRVTCHNQHTLLHYAARQGHTELARMLISKRAAPDYKNRWGNTPLHEAALGGHTDVARLLISEGVKPDGKNKRENTPLHFAAREGQLEFMRLLISEYRTTPYAENRDGKTPLELAARRGGYERFMNHFQVRSAPVEGVPYNDIVQLLEQLLEQLLISNRQASNTP